MTFTWPLALLAALAPPLLLAAYLWQLRRRRRAAVRFSNLELVKSAAPRRGAWRRHAPGALLLAGLAALALAAARPNVSVAAPVDRTSIILALDVSRSMCATDVTPNRLAVAQEAARSFVAGQPKGARIGLVAFAGFAELVEAPTTDRHRLVEAIDRLTTGRGTVIGAATLKALDAIAAVNPAVAPTGGADPPRRAQGAGYAPDIVVLLTDGANTRGIEPAAAAEQAAARGVRVYTIGFGTTNPTQMVCTRAQLGGEGLGGGADGAGGGFGGGGGGGRRQFLVIDEPTLREVAELTGGAFYRAEDADQLAEVFADLPRSVALQRERREVTFGFALVGGALAAGAFALSLRWNRFP